MNRSQLAMPDDPAFVDRLCDWFDTVRRDLPWRDGEDLYGIWISETMLQQTTVQAVIPYWERFMARFPTVAELAAASEPEVLAAWAGLGYYSRARHLHTAARRVVSEFGGRLPRSRDAWETLPGVGPYASGAIASLGLGERVPALDANARRVLSRWAVRDPEAWAALPARSRQKLVDDLGAELVPAAEPGRWNEALMELGALVCGARRAVCADCPVAVSCRAGRGGWPDRVPPPHRRRAPDAVALGLLLIRWRDQVLLSCPGAAPWPATTTRTLVREDFSTLHRGLWGVPMTAWFAGEEEIMPDAVAWPDRLPDVPAPGAGAGFKAVGSVRHGITRYRLHATVYLADLESRHDLSAAWPRADRVLGAADGVRWATFHPLGGPLPPLSRLAEKALQFQ